MDVRLSLDHTPSEHDARYVRERLAAYNMAQVGDDGVQPLAVFLRDDEGVIMGGLLGNTYWGWLSIDILWLDERVRGEGRGSDMIQAAEDEARRRGCHHAHVDTMSFQALPFYLKHSYTVFGELQDVPVGHSRIYLMKAL